MADAVHDHIHVDTDSPPTATYTAIRRTVDPKVFITLERALDGSLHKHVASSLGSPIVFTDRIYQLKLTQAELATVIGLLGTDVNLIDNIHDSGDHAAGTKAMVLRRIVGITEQSVTSKAALAYFLCTVEFEDDNSA